MLSFTSMLCHGFNACLHFNALLHSNAGVELHASLHFDAEVTSSAFQSVSLNPDSILYLTSMTYLGFNGCVQFKALSYSPWLQRFHSLQSFILFFCVADIASSIQSPCSFMSCFLSVIVSNASLGFLFPCTPRPVTAQGLLGGLLPVGGGGPQETRLFLFGHLYHVFRTRVTMNMKHLRMSDLSVNLKQSILFT